MTTFGISQYLYTLAVVNLDSDQWKTITKEIHRFLWNKHYNMHGNAAPHRIKRDIMYTSITKGGFGMVHMDQIMGAARLKRYSYLMAKMTHPMGKLQLALGSGRHLKERPRLDIDDVTTGVMTMLRNHQLQAYGNMTNDEISNDLLMHRMLLSCDIRDIIPAVRLNCIEATLLRRRRITTVAEALGHGRESMHMLMRVVIPQLRRQFTHINNTYTVRTLPDVESELHVYNSTARHWHKPMLLSSRQIRNLIWEDVCITRTKLLDQQLDNALMLYSKISKLRNVQNKTKLLRLLHGDVYCGARLYEFGLTDSDRCIRCFEKETIIHLLFECSYSGEVWAGLALCHELLLILLMASYHELRWKLGQK
jgi:hypothetical protein